MERPCLGADCTDTAVGGARLCPDCADTRDELSECVELCPDSRAWLTRTDAALDASLREGVAALRAVLGVPARCAPILPPPGEAHDAPRFHGCEPHEDAEEFTPSTVAPRRALVLPPPLRSLAPRGPLSRTGAAS